MRALWKIAKIVTKKYPTFSIGGHKIGGMYLPTIEPEFNINPDNSFYFTSFGLKYSGETDTKVLMKLLYKAKHRLIYETFDDIYYLGRFNCRVGARVYK